MDEIDAGIEHSAPVWAVFGDLMWPAGRLRADPGGRARRAAGTGQQPGSRNPETPAGRTAPPGLEKALAGRWPPAGSRSTTASIGISGSVLFALNSTSCSRKARSCSRAFRAAAAYLGASDEMLMVSGFTDDMPVRGSNASSPTTGSSRPSAR
jgi:outer membrane protein OmpA-like peptidoglycan-associated protein